jgi:predicted dehydrogenase
VLPCIHACQAGKDIYAEKPLTVYIGEGRVLVNAVRKYNRIFQVGTQQRSMALNRIACELVRTGGLGKVLDVLSVNHDQSQPSPVNKFPEEPVPEGLNWDMWLNQAPLRPYNSQWLGWMQWRDFAGGQITNWGAHSVDQIQWALGMDGTAPVEMSPIESGKDKVEIRYANGVPVKFILEPGHGPAGGAVFVCEKGKLEINRNKFASNPKEIAVELLKKVNAVDEEKKWSDQTALWQAKWHLQNWLDCIKTREKPIADVEIGHRSISVCHLVNITRQIGRPLKWDPAAEQFIGDEEANKLVNRPRRKGYELPELT